MLAAIVSPFLERGDERRVVKLAERHLLEEDMKTLEDVPKMLLGDDDNAFLQSLASAAVNGGDLPIPAAENPSHFQVLRGFGALADERNSRELRLLGTHRDSGTSVISR